MLKRTKVTVPFKFSILGLVDIRIVSPAFSGLGWRYR